MPDLRRAAEDIVARPLFEPTPVAELEARAGVLLRQRRRRLTGLTVVAVVALVLALAGSVGLAETSGRKRTVAAGVPPATTTTSSASESTTTVVGEATASTAASGATTTAAPANDRQTATTAKATATTVKKASGVVVAPKSALTGGIANVTSPTTASNSAVQPGGAVTMLTVADITGFDPATIANTGADGLAPSAVFDTLLYADPAAGTISPQIATSMTSTDGVTWVLKLRSGVKFTDGTAYDAAAVKFNWERLQDPINHAVRATQANQIQTMEVVDAQTLKITLRSKYTVFPVAVTLMPFIGSPTAMQSKGAGFATDPVGAGPYVLKTWQKDSQMTLVRNPSYWNAPRPYLDQIVVRPVGDESQRAATFSSNQANVIVVESPQTADQLNKAGSGTPNKLVLNGGVSVLFNTTKGPFKDARARQAVAQALDLNDYSKSVDGGLVDPVDSLFRHDSPFYDATLTQLSFNATKAQQLFDQLASERGGPLQFTLTASSAQTQTAAAQYVQAALNKYNNVKVTVQSEPPAQHAANCSAGTFDAACTTVNGFDDPEPGWTAMFTCNAAPSPTGWCDTKFDSSVVDNQQTLDPKQRVADIKTAQTQFYADVPALYLERRTVWTFTAPDIRDFRFANDGTLLVDRVWIQGRTTANTASTTTPPPTTAPATTTTSTTRPPTTTTTVKATTTTAAKPVTTVKPATTTTTAAAVTTTAGPTTTAAPPTTSTSAPPTTAEVALPATTASTQREPLPLGLVLLVVVLAIIFGAASCAAFMVWRQGRGW